MTTKELETIKLNLKLKQAKKNELDTKMKQLKSQVEANIAQTKLIEECKGLLMTFTSETREVLKSEIEGLVTSVLKDVLGQHYSFVISFSEKRGQINADFKIHNALTGADVDPLESSGGGVCDIIASVLLFVFLRTNNYEHYVIFDELSHFLNGEEVRNKYFGLIKDLADKYKLQVIYVTNQAEIFDFSSNIVRIEKGSGGYSSIF